MPKPDPLTPMSDRPRWEADKVFDPPPPEPDTWLHDTRTIREWVNGGGVSSEQLRSELATALVAQSSTAQAVNAIALAIHAADGGAP